MSEELKNKKTEKEETSKDKETKKPDHQNEESEGLIGGNGLIEFLKSLMPMLEKLEDSGFKQVLPDSPLSALNDEDLDQDDPTIQEFTDKNDGLKGIVRIIKIHGPESIERISNIIDNLTNIRISHRVSALRTAFNNIQNYRNINNEVVKLERTASTNNSKGQNQYEAAVIVKFLMKDASSIQERNSLVSAYEAIIEGDDMALDAASFRLRNIMANYMPERNIRTAYTYIDTQANEPFLMCPKAVYQTGKAIAMEVSKCRDHCIDSRVTQDGKISCAYQSWLKVAELNHQALGRLDVARHPDNDKNLLSLKEGERNREENKLDEKGSLDTRMDEARKKFKNNHDNDDNLETKLDDASAVEGGHRGEGSPINKINASKGWNARSYRLAQEITQPLENRLKNNLSEPFKTQEEKLTAVQKNNEDMKTKEQLLNDTPSVEGGHRGESKDSYPELLNSGSKKVEVESLTHQVNDLKALATEESYPELLNKTASTKVVRLDPDKEENIEQQMKGKQTGYSDKTIETLLADEHVGLSEDELDEAMELWLSKQHVN